MPREIVAELEESASAADNKTIFDAAAARVGNYDSLVVPPGSYVINPVTLTGFYGAKIDIRGALTAGSLAAGSILTLGNLERCDIFINALGYATRDWTIDASCLKLNGLKQSSLRVGWIRNGTNGVYCLGDNSGSNMNNRMDFMNIQDAEAGIFVENSGSGCNNENKVSGMVILSAAVKTAESDGWAVLFGSDAGQTFDQWAFDLAIENNFNGFDMGGGSAFKLNGCRMESVDGVYFKNAGPRCTIDLGVNGLPSADKIVMNAYSDGITILGNVGTEYIGIAQGDEVGGFSFFSQDNPEQKGWMLPNWLGQEPLKSFDHCLNKQVHNKQYEASTLPATGNFAKGAMIWNTDTVCGQPTYWVFTSSGTRGALDGVTGTIANGSRTLDLAFGGSSTIDDICKKGTMILIGTEPVKVVQKKNSDTQVYLSAPSGSDQTDVTVSFQNPTWRSGPLYP